MRREGIPASAKKIPAAIPISRMQEGEFRLQVQVLEDQRILCVDRLSHPAIPKQDDGDDRRRLK